MHLGIDTSDALLTSMLSLHKPDGSVFENIKASVYEDGILITDIGFPIEAGDRLVRVLASGIKEAFIVKDPRYCEKIGSIPAHFRLNVRQAVPPREIVLSLCASLETPDFC